MQYGIGRRRSGDEPQRERRTYAPEWLVLELDQLYSDPINHKPIYGYWSQLVTKLLTDHLNEIKAGAKKLQAEQFGDAA